MGNDVNHCPLFIDNDKNFSITIDIPTESKIWDISGWYSYQFQIHKNQYNVTDFIF